MHGGPCKWTNTTGFVKVQIVFILDYGDWTESGVAKCCAHVQEWRAQSIFARNTIYIIEKNNRMGIIMDIQDISFPVLRVIELGENQIACIEGLCRLNMPMLKVLFLGNYYIISGENNISSLRALRKLSWPHLSSINLGTCILYCRL